MCVARTIHRATHLKMKVICRLLSPISFHDVRLEVTREYHRNVMCFHEYYALCRTCCCVLLCFTVFHLRNYRIFHLQSRFYQRMRSAVICADELTSLHGGTACGLCLMRVLSWLRSPRPLKYSVVCLAATWCHAISAVSV